MQIQNTSRKLRKRERLPQERQVIYIPYPHDRHVYGQVNPFEKRPTSWRLQLADFIKQLLVGLITTATCQLV